MDLNELVNHELERLHSMGKSAQPERIEYTMETIKRYNELLLKQLEIVTQPQVSHEKD